ncbi:2-keto-4-pentenoate hydratase [Sphingomonas sp.]|uniref:2-keto-4-pentenoate hydratase n=1 Tax=Sphingomonas sp. TaxID=28214 RepID=UPI0033421794
MQIATRFVDARRTATALTDYPGTPPVHLSDAYAVQDAAISMSASAIIGWKVGRINPPIGAVDRLAGPIFDSVRAASSHQPIAMPVFAGGFAAAEAEFLLQIGTTPDPAKRRYSVAEATALIDAVHVGIEIASSPFGGINDHGAGVTISDFGNNNGLVIGPAIDGWRRSNLLDWPVELMINDTLIGAGIAATMLDGPFGAARFLFELMAERGIALTAGQWISSGAVTGVHPVAVGDQVVARFDSRLTVACTIKAEG